MVRLPAGQLPAWHSSTKLAQFRFVEDRAEGSATRIIDFAPHLSFSRLIQSILKLEHGLGASSASSGTDTEDSFGTETAAQTPAGVLGKRTCKIAPCLLLQVVRHVCLVVLNWPSALVRGSLQPWRPAGVFVPNSAKGGGPVTDRRSACLCRAGPH